MLPIQLQNKDFRFIRINMFGPNARKAALDIAWTTLNNYSYDNKIIDDYIDSGNNYGVCGGYGNLAIIDADNAIVARLVTENLPETFTVKTGGGGMHYYYIIPDFKQTCKLFDGDVHLGEIQFKGTQVIGPNSIHPNGNRYEVINDNSIAVITSQQVMDVLGKYILKYQTVKGEREFNNTNVDFDQDNGTKKFKPSWR